MAGPIVRHRLVKGRASPDDGSLADYWKKREKVKSQELIPGRQEVAKRQQYICPVCKTSLFNDEELHLHHVIPRKNGGKDVYKNLRLLHEPCHVQLHARKLMLN